MVILSSHTWSYYAPATDLSLSGKGECSFVGVVVLIQVTVLKLKLLVGQLTVKNAMGRVKVKRNHENNNEVNN
jgi:hypothetical protein